MAAALKYTDYLLYAAAKDVNHSQYKAVIDGIYGYLNNILKIYIEDVTKDFTVFINSTSFYPEFGPIKQINSITYDGSTLSSDEYSYYGKDILLVKPLADYRKPLIVNADVGFINLPSELKLAIYRHIDHIIFSISKDSGSIEKVVNSTGNTTYFREDKIPSDVSLVYSQYTNRKLIMFE